VIKILKNIFLISAILLLTFQVSIGQNNGFTSKSVKSSNNGFQNKWADAKQDSLAIDSSIHVFGSYNFRDDKDIPYLAKRQIHKGDLYFNLGPGKYDKAMHHYKKAYKIDPNIAYLDFKIGQCYLLMRHNKFRSILYLEKAFHQNKRVSKQIHYYLGRAHHVNNDYPRAIIEYEKSIAEYRKAHRNDHITLAEKHEHQELIAKRIDECKFAMLLKAEPKKVLIESVGDSINSKYSEYDPFISADESIMMFTSRRKGTRGGGKAEIDHVYYEDLYISYNKNGLWSEAKQMKNNFNKQTNDAIIGLSHDGKEIFLYRDTKQGDVYLSNRDDDTWSRPKPIKEINTGYHESSACFSFDKKTIYFVSDKPGGYGGRDIYYTDKKEDGTWGIPQNLGRTINTKYDEERLYIHPNGKTIFFSSQGHNSMGGYDIFFSELDENGKWGKPENLGYPINGPDDEISFVVTAEGNRGYYSSYRPGGKGDRDIYLIRFGISSKMGKFNREDDIISKKKIMKEKEFIAELTKIGIAPIEVEDTLPIMPVETMANLNDMADIWDAEIAELLSLLENTTDQKEINNLKQQVSVKREELVVLRLAANLDNYSTFEQQVKLREDEISSLEVQLDSANKKKVIRNLEAQINVQREELELLQSAYVRGKQKLAEENSDKLDIKQNVSVIEHDSTESNLFVNQNNLTDVPENEIDVVNIQKEELFLIDYNGKYNAFTEDQLDQKMSNLSSTITKENIELKNLKLKLALAATEEEFTRLEQEVKVKEQNIRVIKQEMNLLIDAVKVDEALAEEKIKIEDVNNINAAVEIAKIEMSNNENVDATVINQTENQVTDMQNVTNTEDSVSEAINTTEKESTLVANGTSETNTENSQTSEDVQALEQGSSMILENVLFDYDKSTLRSESYETLDKLVTVMKQPPAKSKVELSGHTDSKGSNDYNQKLAERRAQSVVNYLIEKGISKDRLVAKGYGESRPAAPNSMPDGSDNPTGRQLNRRTELKLLKD
jgi:outer membrane protein OmpA-like peptidoglycan-associated protein/tetratricopeptide (TPR) repeat protein